MPTLWRAWPRRSLMRRLPTMIPHAIQYQYNQYHNLVLKYWAQMTPTQYFGVLIFISFCGWLMMKSANKK